MLYKIGGVLLMLFGACMVLNVLFPLMNSLLGFFLLLIKLIVALVIGFIGYRLGNIKF